MRNLLLLIALFPFLGWAQRSMQQFYQMNSMNQPFEFNSLENSVTTKQLRKRLHIQEIQAVSTDSKGKQQTSVSTFNSKGRLTEFHSKKFTMFKTYVDDTLESSVQTNNRGKDYQVESTYSNGLLVKRTFSTNKKPTSAIEFTYTSFNKVSTSKMQKGRKTYEIVNTYNSDNKLTRTVYNIQGKLKKEWVYECKPEGEMVASKNVAVSSVCSFREESADGSYVIFTRSLRDGIPYLNKQVFSKDSVLILIQSFYKDSILTWERKIEPLVETTIQCKKSGKFYTKNVLQKDAEGNVISNMYFYKRLNAPLSHRIYSLNANGTVQTEQLYYKQKLRFSVTYQFRYF